MVAQAWSKFIAFNGEGDVRFLWFKPVKGLAQILLLRVVEIGACLRKHVFVPKSVHNMLDHLSLQPQRFCRHFALHVTHDPILAVPKRLDNVSKQIFTMEPRRAFCTLASTVLTNTAVFTGPALFTKVKSSVALNGFPRIFVSLLEIVHVNRVLVHHGWSAVIW